MQIRIFTSDSAKQLEKSINDFIKDKEVIDIKVCATQEGDYGRYYAYTVLYEDLNKVYDSIYDSFFGKEVESARRISEKIHRENKESY